MALWAGLAESIEMAAGAAEKSSVAIWSSGRSTTYHCR